ncbi:kinesin-like protein KIN-12B [Oryza glaberrima]|uniref:kinesin-like protein KIN-12B n=1 Tax=Oryza glaberrima TaxID=4538 RepID=UPI00224C315F|nr:kinesin-like protein KIN-12B [Oryza glaberrima]
MRSLFSSKLSRAPASPPPHAAAGGGGDAHTPSSHGHRHRRFPKENVDPSPSPGPYDHHSAYRSPSGKQQQQQPLAAKNRSLPPRPPLKRKLLDVSAASPAPEGAPSGGGGGDSGVQVVVRVRPPSRAEEEDEGAGKEVCVRKTGPGSVEIHGQGFTFDSVADEASTQEDIFQLVGRPLVENCLDGFNSSIFAYGQTGSGKTYTMWGPLSALSDDTVSKERGLTPRVFELLFSRIKEEQAKHSNKQLVYHCCCSFLEIYNEQITDLLDPVQRNLQIREDVGTSSVYVESLTKEFVFTINDVTQLLEKGLANRRTEATTANAESSRSHCVFTCFIKSESKNMEDGSNFTRTSRINLVDLAGSERQKLTNAAGDRLKEAGNINRSLSQLGNLINILAEVSQSGKQRHHIPYRDSKLTFLLQESLGGNAKLAMICAVSPSQNCKSETLSTLRFAHRAKDIKNNAVVNEQREDDVNVLREQIRQLKEELQHVRSNGSLPGSNGSPSTGWNSQNSFLLKMSLSRPTAFPTIKDDSDEEMEIDDNDVEKPCNLENKSSFPHGDVETSRCKSNLAASIQKGLQVIESHRNSVTWRRSSLGLNTRLMDAHLSVPVCKVDVAIQTDPEESEPRQNTMALIPSNQPEATTDGNREISDCINLQLVTVDGSIPSNDLKQQEQVFKAAEKVLAGAIRREMLRDEQCAKQAAEIQQLKRLVQQYKHERECNAAIAQIREEKIARLETLVDGILPTEELMHAENLSLQDENKILHQKYENHPEVLSAKIELERIQEELERYRNFKDEKEVLLEEIQHLKNQLHYMLSSSMALCRPPVELVQAISTVSDRPTISALEEAGDDSDSIVDAAESRWITLTEELRVELEKSKSLSERLQLEVESEKQCSEELKGALEMAMQGHARILEQYCELQEKHASLLSMCRTINDGIEDVKKEAAKAGVRGAESKFINALARQVSILRAEREKERRFWMDENKGLQQQLSDTAEAVQAAGELLVRLNDAEEAASLAQKRAELAEQEMNKAFAEIDNLKRDHDQEVLVLNQRLAESKLPSNVVQSPEPSETGPARYDTGGSFGDEQWREEFKPFQSVEVSKSSDPSSWFYGYDKCNI